MELLVSSIDFKISLMIESFDLILKVLANRIIMDLGFHHINSWRIVLFANHQVLEWWYYRCDRKRILRWLVSHRLLWSSHTIVMLSFIEHSRRVALHDVTLGSRKLGLILLILLVVVGILLEAPVAAHHHTMLTRVILCLCLVSLVEKHVITIVTVLLGLIVMIV